MMWFAIRSTWSKIGRFGIDTINKFEKSNNVKPWIVISRIQNEPNNSTYL